MIYIYSFLFTGFVCLIAQVILDNTKLTPGHITSMFVIIGSALDIFNIYDLIVKSASENYFKALVRDKKINYYILEDLSNIFFTVSDTFASIFLFYDDSVLDNSEMILIESESGINDAQKFYNSYKNYVLK